MSKLVAFPLGSGEDTIWIEVDDKNAGAGMQPAARGDHGVVVRALNTFDEALASVRPAAQAIINALSDLTPQELEITLGIKFTADAKAFVASAGAEATIGIKATWKKSPGGEKEGAG
jgi:hypothetical protein